MSKATKPEHNTNSETTSPSTPEPRVLNAVREFEHGRQRAKKSAHTASWREEKARKRQVKTQRAQTLFEPPAAHRQKGGHVKVQGIDRDERDLDGSDSDEAFDVEFIETPKWREQKLEVDLTNLIRPTKARRSKAGDFEVIPSVRSVLVLDDRDFAMVEDDEPWEYLSAGDDDSERKPAIPSYAEVAANSR
ncbi:unnamed protein product [Somion occarium]